MKSVRAEGCHVSYVGLFREFVGTACCTYGQSNTINIFHMSDLTEYIGGLENNQSCNSTCICINIRCSEHGYIIFSFLIRILNGVEIAFR